MHVLRQIHRALRPDGLVLDIYPLGSDFAVRAGDRGLGFVDARRFARVLTAMNERVDLLVEEGLYEEVRTFRRHVTERFDTAAEALEEATSWEHLRIPLHVRWRLRRSKATPVEFVDTIRYRLFRRLSLGEQSPRRNAGGAAENSAKPDEPSELP